MNKSVVPLIGHLPSISLYLEPSELSIKSEQWMFHRNLWVDVLPKTFHSDEYWYCFKGKVGEPAESRGGSEYIWVSPSA